MADTLNTILTAIGTFITAFIQWVTQVVEFITSNPLLLIFVILAIVGIVIGMIRSWIPGSGV